VYPHIGDLTNLAGYPPLKPNIIFHDHLLDHNLSLRMDHQFEEECKTVPIKDLKYLSKGNVFLVPTLFITSLPEDEQRLSMGEEVGTMQF
jgi:hypothetical protein